MYQINPTPITQFTQMLKSAELSQQKELKIPIQSARMLSITLTELIHKVNQDYESMFNQLKDSIKIEKENVSVIMDGGGFDTK